MSERKTFLTKWSGISCGSVHRLAQIFAVGLVLENRVSICNDEV